MNYLQLTSTDSTLLIVLTVLLSAFLLLSVVAIFFFVRILASINRVVTKAESVVDSVEAAADVLKNVGGKLSLIKLVKNVLDLVQRKTKE